MVEDTLVDFSKVAIVIPIVKIFRYNLYVKRSKLNLPSRWF